MKLIITIKDESENVLDSIYLESAPEKVREALKGLDDAKPVAPKFEMTYVGDRSSNVESVGWLNDSLYVKFQHSKSLYRYDGAPKSVYEDALKAESIGKYIIANVKDKYKVAKVQ